MVEYVDILNKTDSPSVSTIGDNEQSLLNNKSQRKELKDQYSSTNQFNHNDTKDSHLADTIDKSNGNENIYDEMTIDILSQIPSSEYSKGKDIEDLTEKDRDNLINPKQLETIRKIRELQD